MVQVPALEKLTDDVDVVLALEDLIKLKDVFAAEAAHHLNFFQEGFMIFVRFVEVFMETFDGILDWLVTVLAEEDLPEAAGAYFFEQLKVASKIALNAKSFKSSHQGLQGPVELAALASLAQLDAVAQLAILN